MSDNQSDNSDAWGQARAAIAQQPEAWGVETEDGAMLMVFLDRAEAATYCDGAEPVALGRIGGAAIAQPAEPAPTECADNDSPWLVCKPCAAAGKCANASDVPPLVTRLRQERRPTAWTRGLDTDYPTAWEPNLLCHEAAAEIVRLRCLVEAVRGEFKRECDDTDAVLRTLGLDPENCRTDGGSLVLPELLGALQHRDVMQRREARLVTKGLTVQEDADGVWLAFAASTGRHALLNVDRIADSHGGIVSKALRDWVADVQWKQS